jgi:4a-hydroxytetrahydrobiopterin dehydratase
MGDLSSKRCVPCDGGIPKLTLEEQQRLLPQLQGGWSAQEDRLRKRYEFESFMEAMGFLNRVAKLAEDEGHHPDFCVHYNRVDITLWTHAIHGLSENDFILAAKLDAL